MSTYEPPSLAKLAVTAAWVGAAAFSAGWWLAGTVYRWITGRT